MRTDGFDCGILAPGPQSSFADVETVAPKETSRRPSVERPIELQNLQRKEEGQKAVEKLVEEYKTEHLGAVKDTVEAEGWINGKLKERGMGDVKVRFERAHRRPPTGIYVHQGVGEVDIKNSTFDGFSPVIEVEKDLKVLKVDHSKFTAPKEKPEN